MKYPQVVSMPSAVSDWLEEQLEARGIDSEIYTRLILSLLHAHTRDFIYPEDQYAFPPIKKEGGRGVAGHRRVRRAAHWWKHARWDPEQVKRSAAVECLMSAADQTCEIESLVDELCAKLKEVDSENENSPVKLSSKPPEDCKKAPKPQKVSTKELAEKYYAAFPPLNQKEGNSYITSNINLVVGKWPSPEKNLDKIDLITAKWTPGSPKKSKKKPKRQANDSNMKLSRSNNKNRYGYKKANCVRTLTREMEYNVANWEFVYNNNNNNYNTKDQHSVIVEDSSCILEKLRGPANVPELDYFFEDNLESFFDGNNFEEIQSKIMSNDITASFLQLGTSVSKVWSPSRHICAVCQKPKDNHKEGVPLVNSFALMERTNVKLSGFGAIRKDRPFGHIIGGMEYDAAKDLSGRVFLHGDRWFEFVSSVNGTTVKNTYSYMEYLRELSSKYWEELREAVLDSMNKIEPFVEQERSAFARYVPLGQNKSQQTDPPYIHPGPQPYRCKFGRPVRGPPLPEHVRPKEPEPSAENPTEDIWGSTHLYFRPIKSPRDEPRNNIFSTYPDGAMFAINDNWDQVNFQCNETGQLFVKCENGEQKIYQHYKPPQFDADCSEQSVSPSKHFRIKFQVKQNDKACQTVDESYVGLLTTVHSFNKPESVLTPSSDEWDTTGLTESYLSGTLPFNAYTQGSESETADVEDLSCDDFIVKTILETLLDDSDVWQEEEKEIVKGSIWDDDHLKILWANAEGDEISNELNRPDIEKLREEASLEADLLLEEVGYAQQHLRDSMNDSLENDDQKEKPEEGSTDQQEKNSNMDNSNQIWDFASRLEEDCLVNLSILPTLRSVTL